MTEITSCASRARPTLAAFALTLLASCGGDDGPPTGGGTGPTPTPGPTPAPTSTPPPGEVSFYPAVELTVNMPQELELGDFNGDGTLDLLVGAYNYGHGPYAGADIGEVAFLAGNPDGSFAKQVEVAGRPIGLIEVGDVNGDGKLDLVGKYNGNEPPPADYVTSTAPYAETLVYHGNGNGTFQLVRQIKDKVTVAKDFALRDVNRDGRLDLVTAEEIQTGSTAGSVQGVLAVSLQAADGTFQPPVRYSAAPTQWMTLGDFNGDAFPDVALTNSFGVYIMLNNRAGGFGSPTLFPVENAWRVAAGDLDGDGDLDLVFGHHYLPPEHVSIVLGRGDGTFGPTTLFPTLGPTEGLGIADLNRDGRADILVTHDQLKGASLLLNSGGAQFEAPKQLFPGIIFGSDYRGGLVFADLNRDGIRDVAATNPPRNVMVAFGPFP